MARKIQKLQNRAAKVLKIGYSRICACTKIPVFCLPPGPADENKGSRPSLIALQTELLLLYLNGMRRSKLVAPNSNSSSSGAVRLSKKKGAFRMH